MTGEAPRDVVVGRDLTIAYHHTVALEHATFRIPRGRHTAVIGPNGSGKSTLLGAISGLVEPVSGTLEVRDAAGNPVAARHAVVAHVLQTSRENEAVPLTVREVVAMGRYAHRGLLGRLGPADRRAVDTALERMHIGPLAQRQLVVLSGGQRQRVNVAQGLAQEADLLLLDEPVTGLDAPSLARVRKVVAEELEAGRTVVTTTHDIADAAMADHVLLVAGTVVASGTPDDVLTQDNLATAYDARTFTTADGTLVIGDPHIHGHH